MKKGQHHQIALGRPARLATKLTFPLCEPRTELSGHVGCPYVSMNVKTTHEEPRGSHGQARGD